jgi:SNF2 family DNA or RNA helicase
LQVTLGLERMEQLMKLCNKFMLRRTSTVLKALLPAKVEQVRRLGSSEHMAMILRALHAACL